MMNVMRRIFFRWGFFVWAAYMATGCNAASSEPASADVKTMPVSTIDPELEKQWQALRDMVSRKDFEAIKSLSFDTLQVCEAPMSTADYVRTCCPTVLDSSFVPKMANPYYTTTGAG